MRELFITHNLTETFLTKLQVLLNVPYPPIYLLLHRFEMLASSDPVQYINVGGLWGQLSIAHPLEIRYG